METKSNVSWCSWIAVASWLVIGLFALSLYFVCLNWYRRKDAEIRRPIPIAVQEIKSTSEKILVGPAPSIQVDNTTIKDDTQDLTKEVENELRDRVSDLEKTNKELSDIILTLEAKSENLLSRMSRAESDIVVVKQDVVLKDKKTNERIDALVVQFKEIVDRIKVIQSQVESNTADIKVLYQKIEEHRKMIEEDRVKIAENKQQIENVKLMFVNYDTVLAIEKAKEKK